MQQLQSIIILLLLACSGQLAFGQSESLTIPLSKTGSRGMLEVVLHKGPITIKGSDRSDVLVRYEQMNKVQPGVHDQGDGLKKLSGGSLDLEISENNNHVEVRSDSWNSGTIINVEIPRNFDLKLYTYNDGNIYIENVDGVIEAESYNGKIDAMRISGSMVANTYNGPIVATFDRVDPEAPLAFSTYNGKVDISLPSSTKADLRLKSDQGNIYTGFDVAIDKTAPKTLTEKGNGTYKVKIDEWIKGTINGGGPEIMIKNYHGDIYVRKE
ncbi:MAG: hypothetical protein AAGG75_26100 [Bacteroidota bacterium]